MRACHIKKLLGFWRRDVGRKVDESYGEWGELLVLRGKNVISDGEGFRVCFDFLCCLVPAHTTPLFSQGYCM